MKKVRAAIVRLAGALRLTRSDSEIDEELQGHLAMLTDEYRRSGLSEGDARRAASAKFGSVSSAAEACRDRRGIPFFEQWIADCRYAARSLAQTRILTVSMILVLGLGIGVTTTLATVFHALVWKTLPVPDPDRVVRLSLGFSGDVDRRVDGHTSWLSYPELKVYRQTTRALSGAAGFRHEPATWFHGRERRSIRVALVTADYFNVLRVRAARGRLLTDTDARHPVAVISHRLWARAFGAEPSAIGASMLIDRQGYTVVGVAEPSFTGTELEAVDVWLPLDVAAPLRGFAERLVDTNTSWLQVIGRLAPAASLPSAASEAHVIAASYERLHPRQRAAIRVTQAAAFDAGLLQSARDRALAIGIGTVIGLLTILLLLICTSNAAALLLARAAARQQEIAIRIALGAGRARVVQQLVTESVLLALTAGAFGLGLCTVVLRVTAHMLPWSGFFDGFLPDATVLGFATLAALMAGVLFAVAPTVYGSRVDPLPALKQDTRSQGARMPGSRLRHSLVVGQVAISLVLLVISALLARGVYRALGLDSGFQVANLYAIAVDAPAGTATAPDRADVTRSLVQMFPSSPALSTGLATVLPFSGVGFSQARAAHMPELVQVHFNKVDAGYFPTLGVSTVAGRLFRSGDERSGVIVNARLARAFWGDERAAVGQTLMFPDDPLPAAAGPNEREVESEIRPATIVGVVPTLQSVDPGVADGPTFYLPVRDKDLAAASLVVRSPARRALERQVHLVTQKIGAAGAAIPLAERVVSRTHSARVAAAVTVFVGLLTLLVAAAGVYGIVAHAVASRTYEIGVHVALGATHGRILSLVLGSSVRAIGRGTALAGIVLLIASLFASERLDPMFFGIQPLDPLAVAAGLCLLCGVMAAAAYLPARRALGAQPIEALRHI